MPLPHRSLLVAAMALAGLAGCESIVERPPPPESDGIHGFADGCYALDATRPGSRDTRWLVPTEDGAGFEFTARTLEEGSRFYLKAADLGAYLLRDADGQYLVAEDGPLLRQAELESDVSRMEDGYVSGAIWEMQVSAHDPERFQLRHRRSGRFLARAGLVEGEGDAGVVALYPREGCDPVPELTLDAEGEVAPRTFEDGSLYGIVETHAHLLTNLGFGGSGIFHGAPFHPLGVEHALPDCAPWHGSEGRRDLFGFTYHNGGELTEETLIPLFLTGRTPGPNHATAGWPDFTDWPDARRAATHQQQYYLWIQRAYMAGLRLLVQHATTNRIICELMVGTGAQTGRYSCNDMVAVDRIIDATYDMERYIDAQSGGPGEGWFRIVRTPAEARAVIEEGKLAVILGIETSNLFDCLVTPPAGMERCTPETVTAALERYHERGVRAIFPVHKYDNAFSAGDGDREIIELGNWINSGHWSNFTEDCPGVPVVFDKGPVRFAGINEPREEYFSEPPNDFSGFQDEPVATLSPYLDRFDAGSLEGEWCQNAGLTDLGEHLIDEMMARGMILEVDHFPQRSYARVFEILEERAYPGVAGTHGTNFEGRLYALGGVSKVGLGRCGEEEPGAMTRRLLERVALIEAEGGFPAEGFGFDMNGFAGAPRPRFGEEGCGEGQENPITYPFDSIAGDVTFTEPRVGNRVIDFNTEGMVHIGMLPELLEDARRTGSTEEDLEPLFRSAEGYLRMWEAAERWAAER
ncbi:MAG TPA: hypothetical protein RMH85_24870 [Polyangiaceae bacterium LLY-WYZ-15_(1-7)]|nr:hypothetical protein [Sandaracinus sp.]HJL02537.1 hypothetical protein [Polyangiaceae bacterium LLY-WYZ-15_(1-7)]HJL11732.1 hypothetical protein [Polyangiaceae bacterium LLY-WYZ-15_(1-7)]HJL20821.1 hypothetical protein [Polyangiaceae bacterium LLY-WYZ-15_(1-7)]